MQRLAQLTHKATQAHAHNTPHNLTFAPHANKTVSAATTANMQTHSLCRGHGSRTAAPRHHTPTNAAATSSRRSVLRRTAQLPLEGPQSAADTQLQEEVTAGDLSLPLFSGAAPLTPTCGHRLAEARELPGGWWHAHAVKTCLACKAAAGGRGHRHTRPSRGVLACR